jgi:hypothetical protein
MNKIQQLILLDTKIDQACTPFGRNRAARKREQVLDTLTDLEWDCYLNHLMNYINDDSLEAQFALHFNI